MTVESLHIFERYLWALLKEKTGKEWVVEYEQNKWDVRFKCRLEDFRYHTEWFYLLNISTDLMLKEADLIAYRRENWQQN
jgi:hypothetical protein